MLYVTITEYTSKNSSQMQNHANVPAEQAKEVALRVGFIRILLIAAGARTVFCKGHLG